MLRILVVFATLAATIACSYNKMEYGAAGIFKNETTEEGLQVQVLWLKNKKQAADVNMRFVNNYKHPIAIKYTDVRLEMNGEKASLAQPLDGTMTLQPGYFADRVMIFRFLQPGIRQGKATVTIDRISEIGPDGEPTKKKLSAMAFELPVNAY
jgi:hypothetical protein